MSTALVALAFAGGCWNGTPHSRLDLDAEKYFSQPGARQLCKAIEAKNLAEIERLVKSGVDINTKGLYNVTPLLWAFPMGEDVFKKVLELGADPTVVIQEDVLVLKNKSVTFACVMRVSDLMHAAYYPDVPMHNYLKLVLEHSADPNQMDGGRSTPIFYADADQCRLLLAAGADLNHQDELGHTPVRYKVVKNNATHYKAMLYLLEAGADYRIPDRDGYDLPLALEAVEMGPHTGDELDRAEAANRRPVRDWLAREGVNWQEARRALESPQAYQILKTLPADYEHRPWLPQRPTLKKADAPAAPR